MSELDDRLIDGRDAVATMDPPVDLWARVLERSTDGNTVVHDLTIAQHKRRPSLLLAMATVAAVLVVVAALARLDDDQTVDTVPVTEVPQVTEVPPVTTPAPPATSVVPDATAPAAITNGWVAFEADRSGSSDIYLVRPGEAARRIDFSGSETAHDACPAWSPDGRRLSFGRLPVSEDATFSGAELVIVPVGQDGAMGNASVIALDGFRSLAGFESHPCAIWASDGRWVAFGGGGEVWVVDTQTGAIRRLPDLRPSDLEWRPGTDQLAIAGDMGINRGAPTLSTPVFVYSASTGDFRQLGSVEAAHLTWSPDGSTLAYQGDEDDPPALWLVDPDGANERLLVADPGAANHGIGPVWSPTGERIAYQRLVGESGESHEVVLVSVADQTEIVIAPPETEGPSGPVRWYPYYVTWSPDGTTLLYTAWSRAAPGESGLPNSVIAVPADTPTDATVLADAIPVTGDYSHRWAPIQMWGRQPG